MVLDVPRDCRKEFLACLIDWHGPDEPTGEDLRGRQVVAQGRGHVKMILEAFGWITGSLPPDVSPPSPLLWTEHLGGSDWGLFQGLELVARIKRDEAEKYPNRCTWGYGVINLLAEKKFNTQQGVVGNRDNAASSLRSGQSWARLPTL